MKEKIVAFLKSKLTGVSESFLSGVADTFSKTVKEETDIETVITDGIIETLKYSAKELQVEGDRRATEATKTALKNSIILFYDIPTFFNILFDTINVNHTSKN